MAACLLIATLDRSRSRARAESRMDRSDRKQASGNHSATPSSLLRRTMTRSRSESIFGHFRPSFIAGILASRCVPQACAVELANVPSRGVVSGRLFVSRSNGIDSRLTQLPDGALSRSPPLPHPLRFMYSLDVKLIVNSVVPHALQRP